MGESRKLIFVSQGILLEDGRKQKEKSYKLPSTNGSEGIDRQWRGDSELRNPSFLQ